LRLNFKMATMCRDFGDAARQKSIFVHLRGNILGSML